MISLNSSTFLNSSSSSFSRIPKVPSLQLQRRGLVIVKANAAGDKNGSVLVQQQQQQSELKEGLREREGVSVIDMDPKSTVGGGVRDMYGEDTATEDQLVTPWALSVASGYTLLRDPHHNKGLAFTDKERDAHYLRGLLPPACLPITIDVGTNNQKLLEDEFYIGLRQRRATGQEYAELIDEFMTAVKQNYGEKVLVQFEDFANHNAFDLLARYGPTHLVFNDDIQGTASVVLAGLISALRVVGGTLADHRFLFLGAGEAGTGIAELIALEISKQTGEPLEETRKNIWLVDSKGLIVSSRMESLQHFKKPWAHEHEPVSTLIDAVNVIISLYFSHLYVQCNMALSVEFLFSSPQAIKPTVLIGSSGVGQTFTQEVVEAMASFNERPVILALSNPTSQSECTAEQAYTWSKGQAIFASGSPFSPVEYDGKVFVPGQANNAYIFPGFGLGLIISGAIRVHDDMLLAASEALANQVADENYENGLIYPPFSNIRKISANIAASVAAKVYELGLATCLPRPDDLVKYAESCMYSPAYRGYR
ncbi:Malic enzyme, NAD-binding [Dillenia turbinata]|uniref:Malic enzyme n=1 Tax=Dillenia turbinata TaxID=194707 RepID=A0AAN8UN39_9MAGN